MVKGLKGTQEFLKQYGYTLTAYGPYRVSFYRTDTERTPDGLIPDSDWFNMTQKRFRAFIETLLQG